MSIPSCPTSRGKGIRMAQRNDSSEAPARTSPGDSESGKEFMAGLEEAFTVLKGRAMMLVGDPAVADDLVQTTFERAMRSRQRPPRRDVERWLTRILKNEAIDYWRWSR